MTTYHQAYQCVGLCVRVYMSSCRYYKHDGEEDEHYAEKQYGYEDEHHEDDSYHKSGQTSICLMETKRILTEGPST